MRQKGQFSPNRVVFRCSASHFVVSPNREFPCGVIYLNAGVSVATLRTGAAPLRCYGVLQLIGVTLEVL